MGDVICILTKIDHFDFNNLVRFLSHLLSVSNSYDNFLIVFSLEISLVHGWSARPTLYCDGKWL